MTAAELAVWLRERADSYSRDSRALDDDAFRDSTWMAAMYQAIAEELRTVARLVEGT